MANAQKQGQEEFEQVRNRLDWMDEERLKSGRRLVQLEQRLSAWEKDLEKREQRVRDLEKSLATVSQQVARVSRIDTQLELVKKEMVKLIEQYDQRRIESYDDLDKLRRMENENQQREIAAIKKDLGPISRLENEMKLRENEDARLASIVGTLQNRIPAIKNELETWKQELKFVEESERTNAASIAELQTTLLERGKQLESIEARLDVTNHGLTNLQTVSTELADNVTEVQLLMKEQNDRIIVGEHERNKRLEDWQTSLDENQEQLERYAAEWEKYTAQYKEARMAVKTMVEWQEQIEQQQREASELARVEANQMRSKWDKFVLENDKQWKNFEVDREQRWDSSQRRNKEIMEQLHTLGEMIEEIQQDKDTLWRVQNAQADAMKKWPRIWLEEVEKARAHNPNSRRQPALIPVREE